MYSFHAANAAILDGEINELTFGVPHISLNTSLFLLAGFWWLFFFKKQYYVHLEVGRGVNDLIDSQTAWLPTLDSNMTQKCEKMDQTAFEAADVPSRIPKTL